MNFTKKAVLESTNDDHYLMTDAFLYQDVFTDIYLYPTYISVIQKHQKFIIPINSNLSFSISHPKQGPQGLEFQYEKEKLVLLRDFWPRAEEWEKKLLAYITRRDFHEFFKPVRKIGKGNFASVYLAQDLKAHRYVAIKAFMKEAAYKGDGKKAIENEISIMRTIQSTNLVSLYGVYETDNSIYLSMEYVEGTNLQLYLKRHKEIKIRERKMILKALLNGLKNMASFNIVHRDIKPENIIVSETLESIKIVDFGLATDINEPKYIFVRCGTPGFVAPEILRIKDLNNVRLGLQSDMFSLGAIYYQIMYGKSLFGGKDYAEVLQNNRQCRIKLPQKSDVEYGQIQLLSHMLQTDPNLRITPEQALTSVFFKEKTSNYRKPLQSLDNQNSHNQWSLWESQTL